MPLVLTDDTQDEGPDEASKAIKVKFPPQLPDETPSAYRGFICYLMLSLRPRTAAAAYEVYKAERGLKSQSLPGGFRGWGAKHQWIKRALAWDMAQLEEEMGERGFIEERVRQKAYDAADEMMDVLLDLARSSYSHPVRYRSAKYVLAVAAIVARKYDLSDESGQEKAREIVTAAIRHLDAEQRETLEEMIATPSPGADADERPATLSIAPTNEEESHEG